MESKPNWLQAHEENDNTRFTEIGGQLVEIKEMLEPIADTYKTVATLGKWGKIFLGFVLLMFSVVIAFKSLFEK